MSKQVVATEVKSVLSKTAHSAIVASFCAALDSVENSGSIVTQVCKTAAGYMKGEAIPKPDADAIISGIAKARGWKGDAVKVRSSEVRTVLSVYASLPEAIESYRAKAGSCTWHNALRLARMLRKVGNVGKAITMARAKAEAGTANPVGRVAGALKAWFAASRGDKRDAIRKAVAILSTAGLKLELE
jgi:hypothetical protein